MSGEASSVRCLFTKVQMETIREMYEANRSILAKNCQKPSAQAQRYRIWSGIAEVVSRTGVQRTAQQCRQKWRNMKRLGRPKLMRYQRTNRVINECQVKSDKHTPFSANDEQLNGFKVEDVSTNSSSSSVCLFCCGRVMVENSESKLSKYLITSFSNDLSLGSWESESFFREVWNYLICSQCYEQALEYQTALEQLDLIQRKISTLSTKIRLSLSCHSRSYSVGNDLLKIRQQIFKSLEARASPCSSVPVLQQPNQLQADVINIVPFMDLNALESTDETLQMKTDEDVTLDDYDPLLPSEYSNQDVEEPMCNVSIPTEKLKKVEVKLRRCDEPHSSMPEVSKFTTSNSRMKYLKLKLERRRQQQQHVKILDKISCSKNDSMKSTKMFQCPISSCTYSSISEDRRDAHFLQKHEGIPRPYACSFEGCQQTFRVPRHLEAHTNRFHKGVRFICTGETCAKRAFYTQYHFDKHKSRHDDSTRKFPCDECESRFFSFSQLKAHKQTIHRKLRPFLCELCSSDFTRNVDFEDHQAKFHGKLTPGVNLKCDTCGFQSSSRYGLKSHKMLHKPELLIPCTVPNCTYRTAHRNSLKLHMLVHNDEKNFKCSLCPAAFRRKVLLGYHVKGVHEGIKLQCPHCESQLCSKVRLRDHITVMHFPGNIQFTCPTCGKGYQTRGAHRQHIIRCGKR